MIMAQNYVQDGRTAEVKAMFEDAQWYLNNRNYHVRVRTEMVQEFLEHEKFEHMLDIGCGDGSISLPLLNPDRKLTLLDLSQNMLKIARSRVSAELSDNVEVLNEHFMHAQLEPGSYDLIICVGVLAYIDDEEAFVEKLASLVRPGGKLFTECTDKKHFMSWLTHIYDWVRNLFGKPRVSLAGHSGKNIADKFKQAGFQLAATYRYCSPPRPLRKLFNQDFHYRMIRSFFGNSAHNTAPWLGNECIFYFKKPLK
jgi:ubiquinone/menaquinone biosynthesis C-methylase UbiE